MPRSGSTSLSTRSSKPCDVTRSTPCQKGRKRLENTIYEAEEYIQTIETTKIAENIADKVDQAFRDISKIEVWVMKYLITQLMANGND